MNCIYEDVFCSNDFTRLCSSAAISQQYVNSNHSVYSGIMTRRLARYNELQHKMISVVV